MSKLIKYLIIDALVYGLVYCGYRIIQNVTIAFIFTALCMMIMTFVTVFANYEEIRNLIEDK